MTLSAFAVSFEPAALRTLTEVEILIKTKDLKLAARDIGKLEARIRVFMDDKGSTLSATENEALLLLGSLLNDFRVDLNKKSTDALLVDLKSLRRIAKNTLG